MLEAAAAAWKHKYGDAHVEVDHSQDDPFAPGEWLGRGGCGHVYETLLGSIPLALKRIHTNDKEDLKKAIRAEVDIMQLLNKDRHRHIVHLIGSYQKRKRKGGFELGLLIWPIASYDLSALLEDVDTVGSWIVNVDGSLPHGSPTKDTEEVLLAIDKLRLLEEDDLAPEQFMSSPAMCRHLYEKVLRRMERSLVCVARAVQWLHDREIQHKDLKPSQILLSNDGVWLSDFGWSRDMSGCAVKYTATGIPITPKYHAPERASKRPCSLPQDIFGLGCIFLEVGYQLAEPQAIEFLANRTAPWSDSKNAWCFHENIDEARSQISMLDKRGLHHLGKLIWDMLDVDPDNRPEIDGVLKTLSACQRDASIASCCTALRQVGVTSPHDPFMEWSCSRVVTATSAKKDMEASKLMDIGMLHCEESGVKHAKYSEPWNNASPARAEDDAPTISDDRQSLIDSTTPLQLPVSESLGSGSPCLVDGNASRDPFLQAPPGSIDFLHGTESEPELSVFNPWNVADSEQTATWEDHSSVTWPPSYVWYNNESSDQAANWDFQPFDLETVQSFQPLQYNPWSFTDSQQSRIWSASNDQNGYEWQHQNVTFGSGYSTHSQFQPLEPPEVISAPSSTHTGDTAVACEHCRAEFTGAYGKSNLNRHIRIKHLSHERRFYPCEAAHCGKVFHRKDARLKHHRKQHAGDHGPMVAI